MDTESDPERSAFIDECGGEGEVGEDIKSEGRVSGKSTENEHANG